MTPEQIYAMSAGPAMNAAVAEAMGWQPAGGPAPKCPECDTDALRPKCLWEMGASCPRHKVVAEWKARKIPPDYSEDIAAAFEMEVILEQRGLAYAYASELGQLIEIRTNRQSRFDLIHASPADRCKAALLVLARRQEGQR